MQTSLSAMQLYMYISVCVCKNPTKRHGRSIDIQVSLRKVIMLTRISRNRLCLPDIGEDLERRFRSRSVSLLGNGVWRCLPRAANEGINV